MTRKNRWYDAEEKLAEALEGLKETDDRNRDRIVEYVLSLIYDDTAEQIERHHLEYPLDRDRRRWYDMNPYLWLMMNSLQFVHPDLLQKVIRYIDENVKAPK